MLKRIEAGGSYSPQELLEIGLELQRQNEQLDLVCQKQAESLVTQRRLLEEADATSGMKHTTQECAEIYQRAIETWGERLQDQMLAEEAAELGLAALKVLRNGAGQHELQRLAEEIADVAIMTQQAFALYPGLAIAASCEQKRKLDRLKDRIESFNRGLVCARAEAAAAEDHA